MKFQDLASVIPGDTAVSIENEDGYVYADNTLFVIQSIETFYGKIKSQEVKSVVPVRGSFSDKFLRFTINCNVRF